jgi:hypothetical protein
MDAAPTEPVSTRPIPGYPNYVATSDGKILSRYRKWMPLRHHIDEWGYPRLHIQSDGVKRSFYVHRLILLAFVGQCPTGMVARHLDGTPTNNAPSNLVYGTHAQNMDDRRAHGRNSVGTKNHFAKLDETRVAAIRLEYDGTYQSQARLAAKYAVSKGTISLIVRNRIWRHVV